MHEDFERMKIASLLMFTLGLFRTEAFLWIKTEKCYKPYGCFGNKKPYNNAGRNVPKSPCYQKISFLLYTRLNPISEQILQDDDLGGVTASNYNTTHNTKIIFHGFTANGRSQWIKDMTAELLKKEDCNIIAVDWKKGAKLYWNSVYNQASANTRVVGAVTAELINTLVQAGTSLANFHLIGHSLGSHIAGYVGERLPGLGRITGMDPAGPNFEQEDYRVRLDPTDAVFVDVIHSDAETLVNMAFGMKRAVGTADYYPAGGYDQPGCPKNIGDHLLTAVKDIEKSDVACSHGRAVDYFIASINGPCTFKAYPCSTDLDDMKACSTDSCGWGCSNMGYSADPSSTGTFYVEVTDSPPYCCKLFYTCILQTICKGTHVHFKDELH